MNPEELPYYSDLVVIRSFLEKTIPRRSFFEVLATERGAYYRFPKNWCQSTANLVNRVTGLKRIVGSYPINEYFSAGHEWNYDSERKLFVDLTQDQFDHYLPKIVIETPEESKLRKKTIDTFFRKFLRIEDYLNGDSFLIEEFMEEHNGLIVE